MKIGRLPALVRTTTFRLALLHASIFILFSASLLAYLYYETAGHLGRQAEAELNAEFGELSAAYRGGGLDRLKQAVTERREARGKFFYLLQDGSGQKIEGDFDVLPAPAPLGQVVNVEFAYDARTIQGQPSRRSAEGRISRLSEGGVLMVAYDVGDLGEMNRRITEVVWRSAAVGFVLSLIGGVVISRSAAQRAEQLAKTTEGVMGGDLTRRAPVFGSGDEFDRLSEQLNAMLAKLERLVISSRSAGDSIAHDLRSPLTRLRNRLEAGLRDTDKDGQHAALVRSIDDVDGVLDTFNAVLRLSRVQAGATGSFRRTNVTGITDELAELYQPVCEEKRLAFTYAPQGELFVLADRDLVAQAMSNLMDNAVKYRKPDEPLNITMKTWNDEEHLYLSITDTGLGMKKENLKKIFDKFYRVHTGNVHDVKGFGLGLAYVKKIVDLHDGEIKVDSELGKGTTFTIKLPVIHS